MNFIHILLCRISTGIQHGILGTIKIYSGIYNIAKTKPFLLAVVKNK